MRKLIEYVSILVICVMIITSSYALVLAQEQQAVQGKEDKARKLLTTDHIVLLQTEVEAQGIQSLELVRIAESEEKSLADYLENSLFIGDSRTVGWQQSGNLKSEDVFARVGMSVFNYDNTENQAIQDGESLEYKLQMGDFDTVFVMLGVNEVGYPFESIIEEYEALLDQVLEGNPEAKLYLLGNLHVSQVYEEKDSIISNDRIDALNLEIKQLAKEYDGIYFDPNEVYDDQQGAMASTYTKDGIHLIGSYYDQLSDWLLLQLKES